VVVVVVTLVMVVPVVLWVLGGVSVLRLWL
jgi:hypothetical protein